MCGYDEVVNVEHIEDPVIGISPVSVAREIRLVVQPLQSQPVVRPVRFCDDYSAGGIDIAGLHDIEYVAALVKHG